MDNINKEDKHGKQIIILEQRKHCNKKRKLKEFETMGIKPNHTDRKGLKNIHLEIT